MEKEISSAICIEDEDVEVIILKKGKSNLSDREAMRRGVEIIRNEI